MSKATKRREWWILHPGDLAIGRPPRKVETSCTHVREVLPSEVTITRSELRRAYEASKLDTHISEIDAIEIQLFGDHAPEGTDVG